MDDNQKRLARFLGIVTTVPRVVILPHIDPDPDAIASAVGIAHLLNTQGIASEIIYEGRIGRAENKSLVEYLGRPLSPLLDTPTAPLIIVDTQPGAGNSPVAADVDVLSVFDHHPWRDSTQQARYFDVRPDCGATSSMVTEYLLTAGITPDKRLATALFYGIKTDTLELERSATPTDVAAYDYLRSMIDRQALQQIEQAQVSADYFRHSHTVLESAQLYGNLLFCYMGEMAYPDMAAEMADWLMRFDKADWVTCIGLHNTKLYLSVRSHPPRSDADKLALAMVGDMGTAGGHGTMAGGQIPLAQFNKKTSGIVRKLRKAALRHLNIPEKTPGTRLLSA
jgi:nanoRNase/pAp phosphatase (c-di-AMP/oligoRNAs hydrolase)